MRTTITLCGITIAAVSATLLLSLTSGLAQQSSVPSAMNYQGQLVNTTGANLPDGTYSMSFSIYDSDGTSGTGNLLWGPEIFDLNTGPGHKAPVTLVGGQFNVTLDTDINSVPIGSALTNSSSWLQITVTNAIISPRQRMLSAPYALRTLNSEKLNGFGWDAVFDNPNPTTGSIVGSRIGVGTILTAQLASGAVTTDKIASQAVSSSQIVPGAITSSLIANNAISSSSQIAPNTIQGNNINLSTFSGTFWSATGNPGTSPTVNFLGTTDNQPLTFRVNSNEVIRIDTAGRLGIGTSTPAVPLEIAGPDKAKLRLNNTCTGGGSWYTASSDNTWALGGGKFVITTDGGSAGAKMVVDGSGKVGIGLANPAVSLHVGTGSDVSVSGGGFLTLGPTNATNLSLDDNEIMARNNGSFSTLFLNADGGQVVVGSGGLSIGGSLGIGTTSPGAPLDVQTPGTSIIRAKASSAGGASLYVDRSAVANAYSAQVSFQTAGNPEFNIGTSEGGAAASDLSIYAYGFGNVMTIRKSNGYIGMGTVTPSYPLEVDGANLNYSAFFSSGIYSGGNITAASFSQTSDRNVKTNFNSASCSEILAKVDQIPIKTWAFTNNPGVLHVGPMAQDFYAAFGFGEDEKHIATVDADGVALASIQALNHLLAEKDREIETLKEKVFNLERSKDQWADRLDSIERTVANLQREKSRSSSQVSYSHHQTQSDN